jgi:hypothetical protein
MFWYMWAYADRESLCLRFIVVVDFSYSLRLNVPTFYRTLEYLGLEYPGGLGTLSAPASGVLRYRTTYLWFSPDLDVPDYLEGILDRVNM